MIKWLTILLAFIAQDKAKDPATGKEAMQRIQRLVGEWKGTGTPKELKREAWEETLNCGFKIDKEKDLYQLEVTIKDGIFWKSALIDYDLKKKLYTCEAVLVAADSKKSFTGKYVASDRELTFDEVTEAYPRERVVFTLLHDARIIVEFLKQEGKGKDYLSLATVGQTKPGFVKGGGALCVVTGGGGSIPVTYQGKTYYVC